MTCSPSISSTACGGSQKALRRFAKDESGTMTIFACFMILIMLMVGGIGVDLMRNELERTRIQSIADRAVLAAADLDQTQDPEAVVRDYFTKSGMGEFVSNVEVEQGLNFRIVRVDASTTMQTQFMDMMGVDTLPVPASAIAEERVNKVEISMVLDISGSMNDGTKMRDLREAAGEFVDTVLTDSTEDLISINLVPYSQHVNAGPLIYNQLNMNTRHQFSHCVEFDDADYDTTVLDTAKTYEQMQHFQWNTFSVESGGTQNTLFDTVCPRYAFERILPTSQNATQIKRQIDLLQPRAGTQIFIGMKWATAMLDPSFRDINTQLVNSSDVDNVFRGRPVDYSDTETLKTIVLMTDGQNSTSARISNRYYNTESHYAHWEAFNFNFFLYSFVNSGLHSNYRFERYTAAAGDTLLDNMCDAAKERNIVIWTIGFDVLDHGANVMRSCASNDTHFFRVNTGREISEAFGSIARQITQLRLTQ